MAKSAYYLPETDGGKLGFLKNFALKLPGYATALGITPAEVTSVVNDAVAFKYILTMNEGYKTDKQEVSKYKDTMRDGPVGTSMGPWPTPSPLPAAPALVEAGIFARIRKMVGRIKNHPAYNKGIGEDLGIVGDEQTIDIPNLKPALKYRLDAGRPLIIWLKGPADSIDIYVDRKDGKGFVYLANDSQPDYLDTFPIPAGVTTAVWDYKAVYRIGDDPVGQFSEPIQVTVTRKTGN
ncbi:MAG: hypothetical protein HY762_00185 [Planctomycetes bacterium]|nr:hypothetical protein [Planctomycetota bacterium]